MDIMHDIYMPMPPIKEYTVWIKIKSVKKAKPRIVIPEYLIKKENRMNVETKIKKILKFLSSHLKINSTFFELRRLDKSPHDRYSVCVMLEEEETVNVKELERILDEIFIRQGIDFYVYERG